jgi:hypothetical protein
MSMDYDGFAAINPWGGVDYAQMNKGITPIFFLEPVVDGKESEKQGRTVYREMERVRIQIAGDMLSAAVVPVDDAVKSRFAEAYESWSKKRTHRVSGMPLEKWPLASVVMVKELQAMNIYSVEDLAAVSDSNITNIPEGRAWRAKAATWLKAAADTAVATKYAAENERLRADLAELRAQIEAAGVKLGAPGESGKIRQNPAKSAARAKVARKMSLSPEERARRSDQMKAMIAAKNAAAVL